MPPRRSTLRAILLGGLTAGALDILGAFLIYHASPPTRILQSIARGLLGQAALEGGLLTAALGLALHFSNATSAATLYVLWSRRWRWLTDRPILAGALYGIGVFVFMNYVVVPLSAIGRFPTYSVQTFEVIGVHIVGVGIPIALIARVCLKQR